MTTKQITKGKKLEPSWTKNVMPPALAKKLRAEYPIKLETDLKTHQLRII